MSTFISKSNFYIGLKNQLAKLEELTWSDVIPISQSSTLPDNEGILVLLDENMNVIELAIAATNSLVRRLAELQKKYHNISYFQYTLESDRAERFSKRTDFKHILQIVRMPIESIKNVLEDNDPSIKKFEEVVEALQRNARNQSF